MLETHEWDDVLGRLVGVQFRGTERIASSTILDALGVAQDKEARQLARTHTHLEKKSRTVMSRSCVMGTSNNTRFRRFLSWLSGRCSARAKVSPRSGSVLTPGWRPRGALRDAHGLHP